MRLLAAGSIALDTLEGPFGTVTGELGGSALYFALSASLIRPVEIVAPVGNDAETAVRAVLAGRPVDVSRVSLVDLPTYRWSALQQAGTNLDRGSVDGIYDRWRPDVPAGYDGWAFVGSMRPDRQLQAAEALRGTARLLAADSMRSYLTSHRERAEEVVKASHWFFANREELAALGGDPADPDRFRTRWDLAGLVVKAGEQGCSIWTEAESTSLPALTTRSVVDVTGAGAALAGGMLAAWLESGGEPAGLRAALAHGIACASLAISAVGLRGLAEANRADLAERVAEVLG
ncbi:MAG: PfkB family carbohydrate kinase [Candidatus Dormibacteraeota bacterium]|nr:PfkB family carbohydrate kinase [Candidatus Dormibacteraeota bacterium]